MTNLSFEFFPPKTSKGLDNLTSVVKKLNKYNPQYYSVTFGAGGTDPQDLTKNTVLHLQNICDVPIAPHISCVNATKDSMTRLLQFYQTNNIKRLVVLRGDIPTHSKISGDFPYALDLIKFIRHTTQDHFYIEIAAYPEVHPQATSLTYDLTNFNNKITAGANGAITQYFYNLDAYLNFVANCKANNINIPITPGIMPITNCIQLERFSDTCGAELPRWIRKTIEELHPDTDAISEFGVETVRHLCENLLEHGAPGLHFYTLNKDVTPNLPNSPP